ncbi:MAG: C-terminal binding protein [Anaerolineae bacterium]|jgi:D-3-phosphoglycerate dehydrogenase|nr:C-terminal binding protein [Anaerolineae bacterium]
MKKYKIVISDYYYPNLDNELIEFKKLGDSVEIVDCTKIIQGGAKTPEQLIPYIKDADALIVQFAMVTKDVIQAMDCCKVIARYAIGVDTIDISAATQKNIFVANVPDYCIDEVADTAIAHILNAMRKISLSRDLVLNGQFSMDAIRPIKRISETTLGLLGFGNIARDVAEKTKRLFQQIVVYDPYFKFVNDYPFVKFLPFESTIKLADVISIHVPLNDSTRNMISKPQLELMKDGVVIVNTSRGAVIDEAALMDALNSGKVNFCGLDVIGTEDFVNSPFLQHPRVCLTPHIGWNSEGAMNELQKKTAQNVVTTLIEGRPKYSVNLGA